MEHQKITPCWSFDLCTFKQFSHIWLAKPTSQSCEEQILKGANTRDVCILEAVPISINSALEPRISECLLIHLSLALLITVFSSSDLGTNAEAMVLGIVLGRT